MSRNRSQRGFTLVEVMIALAILFAALAMMLSQVTSDVKATNRAKLLTAATGLARAKMYDLEEELLFKGFQDTEEEMEGDFSDEGFPRYSWKAKIEKVELPPLQQMQQGEAAAKNAKNADGSDTGGLGSNLAGLMGGGTATAAAGASAMAGSFDMISTILEGAIRKVTLTITWKIGKATESLEVVCYFSDPKAVDQGMGGLLQMGAGKVGDNKSGDNKSGDNKGGN